MLYKGSQKICPIFTVETGATSNKKYVNFIVMYADIQTGYQRVLSSIVVNNETFPLSAMETLPQVGTEYDKVYSLFYETDPNTTINYTVYANDGAETIVSDTLTVTDNTSVITSWNDGGHN